jgi:C-terminal processing protease CtpA/Prc
MKHALSFIAIALTLTCGPAFAGGSGAGESCAHKDKAVHSAKIAEMKAHGWTGLESKKDEATGAYTVKAVAPGSPAEQAGLRAGDVLVALNGVALRADNKEAIKKVKSGLAVGKQVTYTIARNGAEQQISLTLAPVPEAVLAKWVAEEEAREREAAKDAKAN